MKLEVSEALYSEQAFMCSFLVDIPLVFAGALGNVMAMLWFANFDQELYYTVLYWSVLNLFVFDSIFAFVASVAQDVQMAQVLAMPFCAVFMIFSGLLVKRPTAIVHLQWLFHASPMWYAMQALCLEMARYAPGHTDLHLYRLNHIYDYEDDENSTLVMVSYIVVFRFLQYLALKHMNNLET
jgi:hypothetical protein